MHARRWVQHSVGSCSLLYRVAQLCDNLRCSHGMELANARSSFESESFELQEELTAVREQLRGCERSRREAERRCAQKEEAVAGLEARVSSLEKEIEEVTKLQIKMQTELVCS